MKKQLLSIAFALAALFGANAQEYHPIPHVSMLHSGCRQSRTQALDTVPSVPDYIIKLTTR